MVSFLCCVVYGTIDDCLRNSSILEKIWPINESSFKRHAVKRHADTHFFSDPERIELRGTLIFNLYKTLKMCLDLANLYIFFGIVISVGLAGFACTKTLFSYFICCISNFFLLGSQLVLLNHFEICLPHFKIYLICQIAAFISLIFNKWFVRSILVLLEGCNVLEKVLESEYDRQKGKSR